MKKLLIASLLLGAFYGCSGGGGLVPSGPHSMNSLALHRLIDAAAARNGVSSSLIASVISVESGGNPSAMSSKGAVGLMQLMPGTASQYGVADRFDPYQNVDGGSRYLADLLARYHHKVSLALAAYNAGPGAVDAAGGIPPYSETRSYVARVIAALHSN